MKNVRDKSIMNIYFIGYYGLRLALSNRLMYSRS